MTRTKGWTVDDLPSHQGKLALVTGANSGIGWHTALQLSRAGAVVIMGGRDAGSLGKAAAGIRAQQPHASLETLVLDLANLASVHRAAESILASGTPLDLLINNAGVMAVPERRTTRDGFELTFGTNHLGHFALTGLLLPALLKAPAARVVSVSAMASRWKSAALVDLNSEENYAPMGAYAKSKLANVVFTRELARRAEGTRLSAVAVHPGTADTGIQRHASPFVQWMSRHLIGRLANNPEGAALPSLYALSQPDVRQTAFIGPTGLGEGRGSPGPVKPPKGADDPELGRRLWEDSEQLTHVHYAFE